MNLSDTSDEGSSSEESRKPAKCSRSNTYGASSTTSHGSAIQSEDEPDTANEYHSNHSTKRRKTEIENSTDRNVRLSSRSSISENCSSPGEHFEDYRPVFNDNDEDQEENALRPSFQNSDTKFNKSVNDMNDPEYAYTGEYSEKSKRMMSNMGYKPGKGLGKFEHGRTEPVEASAQKGRRGLGLKPSIVGSVPEDFKWTPDESKPEAKEKVIWMSPAPDEPLSGDQLEEWLKKGSKKLTIDDETDFVEPHILKGVLKAKTIFDDLDDEDLRHARFRSNPYETIGSVIFLNRAAVKMANIDAVCDFVFTNPKKQNGEEVIDKKEILYFADVCAGPGGFSEYILYRRGWRAKGFGFTLKGPNDFKLSDFYAGPPETFHPYYGTKNDGNIFDPSNLMSLKEHVLQQTEDKGVHFLMADGGFSVEGQENIQEILSKQLYLCQCLAALMLVRTGGHFVVKLFDVFTRFSIGLIYIMYRCFDKVCIHKPVTSRPANSERYLICLWKRSWTESAEHHLYTVNSILWNSTNSDIDILELVPIDVIQEDTEFFEYVYKSNCILGERQIQNLLKIAAFSKHKILKEIYQAEMKEQCLQLWNLPDQVRTQPKRLNPDETLKNILSTLKTPNPHSLFNFKTNILNKKPEYIELEGDLTNFKNVYDWHFMFLSSGKNCPDLKIFIGCGGKQVFQLESSGWRSVLDLQITLPAKTLVYGEIVKEYRGQGNNQMYSKSLHIVDALMLGGVDISGYPLNERTLVALNSILQGGESLERQLASASTQLYFLPNEMIVREMDLNSSIYVVHRGKIVISQGGKKITTLTKGCIFGQLTDDVSRPIKISASAESHADLLQISNKQFQDFIIDEVRETISNNPQSKDDFIATSKNVTDNPFDTVQYLLRGRKSIKLPWMAKPMEAHHGSWYVKWLYLAWVVAPTTSVAMVLILDTLPQNFIGKHVWGLILSDLVYFANFIAEFYTMELQVVQNKCVKRKIGFGVFRTWGFYIDATTLVLPLLTLVSNNWNYQLIRFLRLRQFYYFHNSFCRSFKVIGFLN